MIYQTVKLLDNILHYYNLTRFSGRALIIRTYIVQILQPRTTFSVFNGIDLGCMTKFEKLRSRELKINNVSYPKIWFAAMYPVE